MNIGQKVPDFSLPAYFCGDIVTISQKDFVGRWSVLFFYPKDFSSVCPTELRAFARKMHEFENEGAQLFAVSTDEVHMHKKWVEKELKMIKYPLISDQFGELAEKFGVLSDTEIQAYRGAFIIDPEGIVQYIVVSNMLVGRSVDEILRVLQALKTGRMCSEGWKKGDAPLPDALK